MRQLTGSENDNRLASRACSMSSDRPPEGLNQRTPPPPVTGPSPPASAFTSEASCELLARDGPSAAPAEGVRPHPDPAAASSLSWSPCEPPKVISAKLSGATSTHGSLIKACAFTSGATPLPPHSPLSWSPGEPPEVISAKLSGATSSHDDGSAIKSGAPASCTRRAGSRRVAWCDVRNASVPPAVGERAGYRHCGACLWRCRPERRMGGSQARARVRALGPPERGQQAGACIGVSRA